MLGLSRATFLLMVAALTVGIVVSGFIIGLTFYTPYQRGGFTPFGETRGEFTSDAYASSEVSDLTEKG